MKPKPTRTPQDVTCTQCKHRWTVAYLPMAAATFARVLRSAHCPMCGATSRHSRIAIDEPPAAETTDAQPG